MAGRSDYYAVLGVEKGASPDEIKRAYRKLARKWHPDVNPGDTAAEDRFKEISEAYHVLGDDERRRQYNQVGPDAFAQQVDMSDFAEQFGSFFHGGFNVGGQGRGGASDFGMFEEVLGGLGGPGRGGRGFRGAPRPTPGRDVQVPLQLSFAEAVRGVERTVAYRHSGGTVRTRVVVPAGVKQGAKIRVRGKGEASPNGGPAGNLLLEVTVQPHPYLRREGNHLRTEVAVTFYEAILGGKIQVPTLEGESTINLPPNTRAGQVFRLRGKGVAPASGPAGDLLAKVTIQPPTRADEELVALMEKFRAEHAYNPRTEDVAAPPEDVGAPR